MFILEYISIFNNNIFIVPRLSGKTEYQATHGGRLRRASTFERRPSKRYPSRTQSLGKGETYQHKQTLMTNCTCFIYRWKYNLLAADFQVVQTVSSLQN